MERDNKEQTKHRKKKHFWTDDLYGLRKSRQVPACEVKMASSKEYLDFILEQLSELDDVSYRAMMGEYIIYYRGKVVGGIYDDRFLVKPTKSAAAMMPNADMELPAPKKRSKQSWFAEGKKMN